MTAAAPDPLATDVPAPSSSLARGVSVVVATRGGRHRIPRCLDSLLAQDIERDRFEVIVVVNGEDDGTTDYVADVRRTRPRHRVRLIDSDRPGAGRARNLGVAAARFDHVTFVDDDDTVGPRFASTLLSLAGDGVVAAVPLIDVMEANDGELAPVASAIGDQIARHAGQDVSPGLVPSLIACNAAKLVPTELARRTPFRADLASGEDVVFFARLVVDQPFLVRVAARAPDVEYRRHIRAESLSRRSDPDWTFAVEQRIAVLGYLDTLARSADPHQRALLDVFMAGQVDFIRRYLERHPDGRGDVVAAVEAAGLRHVPFRRLNDGAARELVVSYCFPPDLDTSGIVAAKRVQAAGRAVDVISNRMSQHRATDAGAVRIAAAQIERHMILDTEPDFNSWDSIGQFCRAGLEAYDTLRHDRPPYEGLYSRALWPASHVLAALIKARQPDVRWRAEYSDPMSHDIHGRRRPNPLEDDEITRALRAAASAAGRPVPADLPMFSFVEALPMALADELIFTNPQQRDVMLDYAPTLALRDRAAAIATVAPHPTLPDHFYRLDPVRYPLDPALVHLAYFGAFYASRGLDDVLDAIGLLDTDRRRRVLLHVFTSQPRRFAQTAQDRGVGDAVVARPYVSFLRFLNLCTQFDVLVLSDTDTAASHRVSPYLPSKWSDYRGGGRPIWAILEPGSPLSAEEIDYRSPLGDGAAGRATLESIIDEILAARPGEQGRSADSRPC